MSTWACFSNYQHKQNWQAKLPELNYGDFLSFNDLLSAPINEADIFLVQSSLLAEDWQDNLQQLQQKFPEVKLLLVDCPWSEAEKVKALHCGVMGFVDVDISNTELQRIISCILKDEPWVERKLIGQLLTVLGQEEQYTNNSNSAQDALTPKEKDIASFVAKGATNAEIANDLNISERTVKAHLSSIFNKLQIQHRVQLALLMHNIKI